MALFKQMNVTASELYFNKIVTLKMRQRKAYQYTKGEKLL